ncbi:hypothetical protein Adu01nite_32690 [Paractinoplanes durhamensis]|uniref:Carbohydrate kinase PfkB domain-containing protein n=2 Tax=Paractinoplanes durhamensis TaxID=113563 RepID=A0ABQ3YX71_9ACTN|nr:hypothetical protein Adu01nite_32690 [Actinoplanes durhamensis]
MRVVVVGQLARDIVLTVDELPAAGTAVGVSERVEMLGGKGANQAVAVAKLGVPVSLIAVTGDDHYGDQMLALAISEGVDVRPVVRRRGTPTGLSVAAVDADGDRRYLEHLPDATRLTADDVDASADLLRHADAVMVQLEQPAAAVEAAIRYAREGGAILVMDGEGDAGPGLIVRKNEIAWRDPRWGEGRLDLTEKTDEFTAALTVKLLRGAAPAEAARRSTSP